MPHTMVTFRLHRSGVILLIVFVVVLAILIYVAGYLTATFTQTKSVARDPLPVARVEKPKAPPTGNGQRATPPATKESLTLRVAVLTSEEDAKAQLASLTAMGLKPSVIQMPTSSGVTLHNIVVGHFESRDAANAAARELQSRLGFLPVVIPAPPPSNL